MKRHIILLLRKLILVSMASSYLEKRKYNMILAYN